MKHFLLHACIAIGTLLSLASCYNDEYAADTDGTRATMVELSLTMPLSSVEAGEGYENGTIYENSINTYRIYFYDYDTNQFIAGLNNVSMSSDDRDLKTKYTITGKLAGEEETNPLEGISNFKVVMLANWDTYTEPTAGSTIEDLCEAQSAQYAALTSEDMDLSKSNRHLPYYGVHAYTGVVFPENGTVRLDETLTLLRAVAKVEVVIDNDEDNAALASATLHRYNSKGYCAPSGVYSEDDYGQANDWASDYTGTNIHLVGDGNDRDNVEKTLELVKVKDRERDANGNITQKETWMAYVPEYDNSGTDYSYISLEFDHQLLDENYSIYFAVYDDDGATHAYDDGASDEEVAKRRDIHRNNLYRFNVTLKNNELRVFVETWENVFDNEWTFGDLAQIIYNGDNDQFTIDGVIYESLVKEGDEVDEDNLTCSIKWVSQLTTGNFNIPETVTYLGYTYTVVTIGENCFDGDQYIQSIVIPATVTSIESQAFHADIGLVSIIVLNPTPPTCADNAFAEDNLSTVTLLVPEGSVDAYKAASVWSSFGTIEAINTNN